MCVASDAKQSQFRAQLSEHLHLNQSLTQAVRVEDGAAQLRAAMASVFVSPPYPDACSGAAAVIAEQALRLTCSKEYCFDDVRVGIANFFTSGSTSTTICERVPVPCPAVRSYPVTAGAADHRSHVIDQLIPTHCFGCLIRRSQVGPAQDTLLAIDQFRRAQEIQASADPVVADQPTPTLNEQAAETIRTLVRPLAPSHSNLVHYFHPSRCRFR